MDSTRTCKHCGIEKPLVYFSVKRLCRGGLDPVCKECRYQRTKDRHSLWGKLALICKWTEESQGLRRCSRCHEARTIDQFPKAEYYVCRTCSGRKTRQERAQEHEARRQSPDYVSQTEKSRLSMARLRTDPAYLELEHERRARYRDADPEYQRRKAEREQADRHRAMTRLWKGLARICKATDVAQRKEVRKSERLARQEYLQSDEYKALCAERKKEKKRGARKRFALAHPDYVRSERKKRRKTHEQRRRARERELPAAFTATDRKVMYRNFNDSCAYCGRRAGLFDMGMTLQDDHFIPLADLEHCPGTVPTNMVPACQDCNIQKRDYDPYIWVVDRFGKRKSREILRHIETYFASLKETD